MRKLFLKRTYQRSQFAQKKRRKPSLWIRPQSFSLEMGGLSFHHLSPTRTPTFKGVIRFALNLTGVLVVLAAAWFLLSEVLMHAYTGIGISNSSGSFDCIDIKHCAKQATVAPTSTPTPSPTMNTTLVPAIAPTQMPTPQSTPDPTPSPTATPTTAKLDVTPSGLAFSRRSICITGRSMPLTLTNAGGTLLIWSQDMLKSSHGIYITDPTKSYMLSPGKSVRASVSCLPGLAPGQYTIVIDYNGGVQDVPVKITM